MGVRIRFPTVRPSAALAVAALAIEAVISGIARDHGHREQLLGRLTPPNLPSEAHVLSIVIGLALLAATPMLWRGTRTAVSLAIAGLATLVALSVLKGNYDETALQLGLCVLLAANRSAFTLGCRNRPKLAFVCAALGAWALAYCALRVAPLVTARPDRTIERALHRSVAHALRLVAAPRMSYGWISLIDALILAAAIVSVLAVRSLMRPMASANRHAEREHCAAREIVARHGEDSLSPFILRPDKALQFAAGGVLSYRARRVAQPLSPSAFAAVRAAESQRRRYL